MEKNLLEYKGQLSSEVRIQLLDFINCVALFNLGQRNDLKKLVGIALELLDNAQRYNASNDVDFHWRIVDDTLVVSISNTASRTDAERLMNCVRSISTMTEEQLSAAFKEQMLNQGFGEKGGAGLGMLQIARKGDRRITADIEPTHNDLFRCTSKVTTTLKRA